MSVSATGFTKGSPSPVLQALSLLSSSFSKCQPQPFKPWVSPLENGNQLSPRTQGFYQPVDHSGQLSAQASPRSPVFIQVLPAKQLGRQRHQLWGGLQPRPVGRELAGRGAACHVMHWCCSFLGCGELCCPRRPAKQAYKARELWPRCRGRGSMTAGLTPSLHSGSPWPPLLASVPAAGCCLPPGASHGQQVSSFVVCLLC